MRGRRKQEDKREVKKKEEPKGDRGGREERKQTLHLPTRNTQWKEGLLPEFMCFVMLKKKSCFYLLV